MNSSLLLALGDEADDDDDALSLLCAVTALIIYGATEDRRHNVSQRRCRRGYLCRPQLLPNPQANTPWTALLQSHSDNAYISTMGVTVAVFQKLLVDGFAVRWELTTICRQDTRPNGNSRSRRRSLDSSGALGLTLHWLTSTMRQHTLCQIFALVPATVSRYLSTALPLLLETLQVMPDARISWPRGQEFHELSDLVSRRHPLLTGVFGSIDGLNLPCQTSEDPNIEAATYNGWLHAHFISSVIVFSPKGEILSARINCPGSWHDSRVASRIYSQLELETPPGFCVVADSAFPTGGNRLAGKILVALRHGQPLPLNDDEREGVLAHSRALLSFRQTAEWGMREIQGSFGRLRLPLDINDRELRLHLLETCFRLHNLKARLTGINHIRRVYFENDNTDENVWGGMEDILFPRQYIDRISRFHVAEEWTT